jgi:outer membrane protein TolC
MPSSSVSARARGGFRPAFLLLALILTAPFAAPARAQTPADTTRFDHFGVDSLPPPVAVGERWSLARCVETALRQNGDVRVARARTRQASGSALSAWNGILPSLDVSASRSRFWPDKKNNTQLVPVQQGDSTVLVEVSLDRRDQTTLDATAQTNLISVPGWMEKRRRDRLHEGARWSEAETRNTVAFQVKQQYFNLLKAERLAAVSRESELLARDEERRSEALFEVGTVARGDVLKARARRAQTQLDRIRAYNQVQIQTARLKQVIGLPPDASIAVEPILEEGVAVPDSASAVRTALERRPQLESAHARERAARAGVTGAWGARLPQLTASYFVSHAKTTNDFQVAGFNSAEEISGTDRSGELRLSMPIFDGLAIEGNVRQARGALAEAEASRRQLELDVAVEVQSAWLALREAVERIDVAREGLASAEEDYNFSKSRYELGAGTFLDLLNAEVSLAQARQSLVEAQADARTAEADLERAIGERRY